MIISNRIKIIPLPFINTINPSGNILLKPGREKLTLYALNDLDLEERQRRKKGSNYYVQKLKLKFSESVANERVLECFTMPCIIEVSLLDGTVRQWGDFHYPVRADRKSRGIGSEYTLERTSLSSFLL